MRKAPGLCSNTKLRLALSAPSSAVFYPFDDDEPCSILSARIDGAFRTLSP